MLGRGRLDEPLEGELNARRDDERGDAILGHLEHLRRLVLDDIEARAACRGGERKLPRHRAAMAASQRGWKRNELGEHVALRRHVALT